MWRDNCAMADQTGVIIFLRDPDAWMEESATYQEIFEKGFQIGRIQGLREVLLRHGTLKFGNADASVVAALEAISDAERLLKLGESLLIALSWDQMLA